MSLTRAAIEAEIVDRIGPRLVFVGMSIATDGANSGLNGPIRKALAAMGFPTATPLVVTDGDLSSFIAADSIEPSKDAWRVERLCDLACLQALQSMLFKTTDVDWKAGVDEVKAHQFVDDLRKDLLNLEAAVAKPYGPNVPAPVLAPMTPEVTRLPNDPFDPCRSRSTCGNWPYP